jgi:hypothetical protein
LGDNLTERGDGVCRARTKVILAGMAVANASSRRITWLQAELCRARHAARDPARPSGSSYELKLHFFDLRQTSLQPGPAPAESIEKRKRPALGDRSFNL